ncbi:hypothetical protein EMIHUDRAFT_245476, partial [Emiliania huxleyi CCMP1516]|uniref:Uncharacterized protein n=2 Tax=Emiliania huxleyi TaxID=2903 RepID=A0A0D3IX87_EMIH1
MLPEEDTARRRLDFCLRCIDAAAQVRDCWAVAFGDAHSADSRVVAAGYDNGDVKLLDLVAGKLRFETNVSNGVCG